MSDYQAVWVIGDYEGERAKKVLELAHSSIGYIVLEEAGNRYSPSCLVAFRYTGEMPVPHHLTEVKDPHKIQEYEKTRRSRQGLHEKDNVN